MRSIRTSASRSSRGWRRGGTHQLGGRRKRCGSGRFGNGFNRSVRKRVAPGGADPFGSWGGAGPEGPAVGGADPNSGRAGATPRQSVGNRRDRGLFGQPIAVGTDVPVAPVVVLLTVG